MTTEHQPDVGELNAAVDRLTDTVMTLTKQLDMLAREPGRRMKSEQLESEYGEQIRQAELTMQTATEELALGTGNVYVLKARWIDAFAEIALMLDDWSPAAIVEDLAARMAIKRGER